MFSRLELVYCTLAQAWISLFPSCFKSVDTTNHCTCGDSIGLSAGSRPWLMEKSWKSILASCSLFQMQIYYNFWISNTFQEKNAPSRPRNCQVGGLWGLKRWASATLSFCRRIRRIILIGHPRPRNCQVGGLWGLKRWASATLSVCRRIRRIILIGIRALGIARSADYGD